MTSDEAKLFYGYSTGNALALNIRIARLGESAKCPN
jgi:hypothetical protein